jgi:hypothetical protein
MDAGVRQQTPDQLALAKMVGNPTYFFDTSFLLANVASLAGWNQSRLEAAIDPRLDTALSRADVHFSAENGFYVVFGSPNGSAAHDKAMTICADILRHFYGDGKYSPEHAAKVCRLSSVQSLADDLGLALGPRGAQNGGAAGPVGERAHTPVVEETIDGEDEKDAFKRELTDIFRAQLNAPSDGAKFLFTPCWDSKKEQITSFSCDASAPPPDPATSGDSKVAFPQAEARCKLDIISLAAATTGVRHITARGDVALVSVAVHVETLSWAKTRNAYLEMLRQIDSRFLPFLGPRVVGLDAGANLNPVAQWIAGIRRRTRWSFVHLPNLHLDFSRVGVLGATGFSLAVPSLSGSKQARLKALSDEAGRLKRICLAQNAIACVNNVASSQELLQLSCQGVRIIAGPVIGRPAELPGPTQRLSFEEGRDETITAAAG